MKAGAKTGIAVVVGTALGALYFTNGEKGFSRETRCSYLSPWTTDLAAWVAGATLIWIGHRNNSFITSMIGSTIATLHIAQFAAYKIQNRQSVDEIVAARNATRAEREAKYREALQGQL